MVTQPGRPGWPRSQGDGADMGRWDGSVHPTATAADDPHDLADLAGRLLDAASDSGRPGLDLPRGEPVDPGAPGADPRAAWPQPAALRPVRRLPAAGGPGRPRAVGP